MALDPEKIASALNLNLDDEAQGKVVELVKARIEEQLAKTGHAPFQKLRAESNVMDELTDWSTNVMMGDAPTPTNDEGWRKGVDACVVKAESRLVESLELGAKVEAENLDAFYAQEERHGKEAARLDDDAEELGLPTIEELDDDLAPNIVNGAGMDEVAVARLGRNDAVATSALSSCTGVSLFDPETKVGAIMHVYQGKVTINDAVEAMQLMDPRIEPGKLQVTLMPGAAGGVNMSHLESLHDQLEKAGITKVRDFSKEGRKSTDLILRGDGVVLAPMKPLDLGVKTDEPAVESPAKKPSVGEVLKIGKHSPAATTESLGAGGPSTGSTLKRSQSEPDLRTARRM